MHFKTSVLKTPPTSHLSTPMSPPPLLIPFSLTLTPTITITLLPYIHPKLKTTHQPSTLTSPSTTQTVPFILAYAHPLPLNNFLYLACLVFVDGTNTSISLLMLHTRKKLQFQIWIQTQMRRITFLASPDRSCLVKLTQNPKLNLCSPSKAFKGNRFQCPLISNWTLVLVPFSYPMKSSQWVSVDPTVLVISELIADEHDIARVLLYY